MKFDDLRGRAAVAGVGRIAAIGLAVLVTLVFLVSRAGATPAAVPVVGDWQGALSANGAALHLALHLTQDKDGKLGGTMDSLDQGANGIVITAINFKAPDLHFEISSIAGTYDGKIGKNDSEIAGTWSQSGASLPLTFTKNK